MVIPAYQRLVDDERLGSRIRDILVAGVSTRRYRKVLPQAAHTVGVSKSAVSRHFVQASARQLAELNERRVDQLDLLVLYIDGIVVHEHHVVAAIGVDAGGRKHLLGLKAGATENRAVVNDLLSSLIARGLRTDVAYLFVIDGAKALRAAVEELFGDQAHIQRSRTHKVRNVVERLPKPLAVQVKAAMHAAYKLDADDGIARLKQQAKWLRGEHAEAASSLLEELEQTFTVNRMGLTAALRRCLSTTNIIENPNGRVRDTARRVKRYRDRDMVLRWTAAGFLEGEKSFRRIQGIKDLWMLSAALGRSRNATDNQQRVRAA